MAGPINFTSITSQSLEQSARVRTAASLTWQTSLLYFYPERPDIVEQAKELAKNLGGQLSAPTPLVLEIFLDQLDFRLSHRQARAT